MKMIIEFYRVRSRDGARAVIGREVVDARDLDAAMTIGAGLLRTLDMPQRPDGMALASPAAPSPVEASPLGRTGRVPFAASEASAYRHFGRRVEADRSWTVYEVFSGVPANVDGRALAGLSHADATSGMAMLNRREARIGFDGR